MTDSMNVDKKDWKNVMIEACESDDIEKVEYLFKVLRVGKEDFLNEFHGFLQNISKFGCIKILKYLFDNDLVKIGYFDSSEGRISNVFYFYDILFKYGHLEIIIYLFEKFDRKCIWEWKKFAKNACKYGHEKIVVFMFEVVGVPKESFSELDNYAVDWAFMGNYVGIVKYLHEKVGLDIGCFKLCKKSWYPLIRISDEMGDYCENVIGIKNEC